MAEQAESKAKFWARKLAPYRAPSVWRSWAQVATTSVLFAAMWALMFHSLAWSYWITLLLAVPTAGLVIRLFIIQHDCGHGSFFRSKTACGAVGSAIGVLSLTPYSYWKSEHAIHHATSGLLDKRGHGDIDTLTVAEYEKLSPGRRFLYRLYRSPLVLFVVGPAFLFLLKQRLPLSPSPRSRAGWMSVLFTNLALAGILVVFGLTMGLGRFLMVQLPVTILASSMGVWLFYVQHQFADTYWRRKPDWDYYDAALEGCTYYALGRVLKWFTGSIGLHHIHHLNSKIPNYRLQECLDAIPELGQATKLTLLGSLSCARLALWDESSEKLIGFPGRAEARPVRAT